MAKSKLTPSGLVKITINGKEVMETEAGSTLLTTFLGKQIFLPSACGGGGTCAMCKCQVLSGGGEILTTEVGYFTQKGTAIELAAWLPGKSETGYGDNHS